MKWQLLSGTAILRVRVEMSLDHFVALHNRLKKEQERRNLEKIIDQR